MNEVRLELRARNNVLWHAIFDLHRSVAEFCRAYRFGQGNVGGYLNLTCSPYAKKGTDPLTPDARRLCSVIGLGADELFPVLLYSGLIAPRRVAEVSATSFVSLGAARRVASLPSADDLIDRAALRTHIARSLSLLSPREQRVIRLRFGLGDEVESSLRTVADALRVSVERARQIEAKALRKLRNPARSRNLRPFVTGVTEPPPVDVVEEPTTTIEDTVVEFGGVTFQMPAVDWSPL